LHREVILSWYSLRRPRSQQAALAGGGADTMRLGLIGSTGHWLTYAPAIERVRGLTLAAVAAAGPEETTGAFDHAPGLSVDTRRYDDARKML
jgi:predicted dehydrogenase